MKTTASAYTQQELTRSCFFHQGSDLKKLPCRHGWLLFHHANHEVIRILRLAIANENALSKRGRDVLC
jgi:hypothetical protein